MRVSAGGTEKVSTASSLEALFVAHACLLFTLACHRQKVKQQKLLLLYFLKYDAHPNFQQQIFWGKGICYM